MGIDLYQILLFLGNIWQIEWSVEPTSASCWNRNSTEWRSACFIHMRSHVQILPACNSRSNERSYDISLFGYTREIGIPSQRLSGLDRNISAMLRKPWHNEPAQWYGSMFKVISNLIWSCCNWHCHVSSKVGTSHEEAFSQEGCLFEWLWSHLDRFKNLKTTFEAWKRRFILGHVNVWRFRFYIRKWWILQCSTGHRSGSPMRMSLNLLPESNVT